MKAAELEATKRYVREGSPAMLPMDYVGNPIEALSKYCSEDSLTIKVSHASENANEDESVNTSYGRVIVEGKIPGYDVLDSGLTLGFAYALDKQIPEFITYMGHTVFSCTNLCISADEDVSRFRDNHKAAQAQFKTYLDGIEKEKDRFITFHNRLQNKELGLEDLETSIGHIIRKAIGSYKQIGTSSVVSAYKSIVTSGSSYSMQNESTDMWNVYNAITDNYSKKFINNSGLIERPIKTKELSKLFIELCPEV
jgi:hypothetical protein